ncbi:putative transcriptional regulator SLK2 [Wolffia australiana]
MNRVVLNSAANSSAPSVGASSLVTDANSSLSAGPHLQRSASINTESYLRLPASPMSFSSNNISMDGSSMVQQSSLQDPMQKPGASTATSQSTSQEGGNMFQLQKKARIDVRHDDVMQQQVMQQLLQRQDSLQMNPQMQTLIQQRLFQQRQQQHQQQMLQSLPPMQRAQIQQQQQQQQLRQQLQQQMMQGSPHLRRPLDSGVCSRRLMQYLYHQRHRPPDNNILYWRKFVTEYFTPRAKKRWCLSLYENVGNHALGIFPQSAMDVWHCEICTSKSGKGFEASFEVLPRLNKIKFDSGVVDELLFLDMPHEQRLPSGILLLEYAKVTQQTVYDHLRVVREGQLRIKFTPDLKILSWDFCARRHDELLPRRLVAPQVSQLVQVAQKYHATMTENGSSGVSPQDLHTSCNSFMAATRQLTRNLDIQSLNELGFSKRYVRCLQISEVLNSMKDLIDFSRDHKMGPIESLKSYPRHVSARPQNQRMQAAEQLLNSPSPGNPNAAALSKIMAVHPSLNDHMMNPGNSNDNNLSSIRAAAAAAAAAGGGHDSMSLTNYQSLLRQNSINPNPNALQGDMVCGNYGSAGSGGVGLSPLHQSPVAFQNPAGTLKNTSVNYLLGSHQRPPPQMANNPALPQATQQQQQVIQQLLQEMMGGSRGSVGVNGPPISGIPEDAFSTGVAGIYQGRAAAAAAVGAVQNMSFSNGGGNTNSNTNGMGGMMMSRNSSFKSISSSPSPMGGGGYGMRSADASPTVNLPDLVHEISREFGENGLMSGDGGADMGGYGGGKS